VWKDQVIHNHLFKQNDASFTVIDLVIL